MANDKKNTIAVTKAAGKWTVIIGGAVYAESSSALKLERGESEPVVYFPRSDVAMAFFDKSEKVIPDPDIGEATYYSIDAKSRIHTDVAWSFEAPSEAAASLKDYMAFEPGEMVNVEQV